MDAGLVLNGLVIVGSVGTLAALYYAILLSKETSHERYWLSLAAAAGFFAIHQWLLIPWELGYLSEEARLLIEQTSVILSSLFFGYSVHGLYSSMRRVNEKMK